MNIFNKKVCLGAAVMAFFCFSRPAFPIFDSRYDSKEDLHQQYEASAAAKMTRGLTNVAFGWTEIGRTPASISAGIEHGALAGFLLGVPYGVLRAVTRTGVGAYETATFFAPQSPIMKEIKGDVQ